MVLAHFAGQGSGVLDIPPWALAYAVFAAAVITVLWSRNHHIRTPRPPAAPAAGATATRSGTRIVFRTVVGGLSTVTFLALLGSCWFGPDSIAQNIAPLALVGVLWPLGGTVSLVAGPVWEALDPFGLIAALGDRRERKPRLPRWAPVPVFATFVVVWVAWTAGDEPRNLAIWLTGYTVLMVVVALRGGSAALRAFDPLPVALDFAAGILWAGRARRHRAAQSRAGHLALLAAMLLAAVGANRISAARWFTDLADGRDAAAVTGLVMAVFAVAGVGIWFLWRILERRVERVRGEPGSRPLAGPLATAAGAVLLAWGLPVGLVQLQNLIVLASDPLARGWNLFGTAYWQVSLQPLSPFTCGLLQAGILLVGHLSALAAIGYAATDRDAGGATTARRRLRGWNAALPAMVVTSVAGVVWTLFLLGQ